MLCVHIAVRQRNRPVEYSKLFHRAGCQHRDTKRYDCSCDLNRAIVSLHSPLTTPTNSHTTSLHRIKIVLKKKKRTGKRLAQQLGKDEGAVSRWCRNIRQPNLETLFQVADLLDVDVNELLESTRG
jgi:hypothetical protein